MRWLLWNVDWSLENNRIHCSSGASLQATGLAHEMHGRRQLPQSGLVHDQTTPGVRINPRTLPGWVQGGKNRRQRLARASRSTPRDKGSDTASLRRQWPLLLHAALASSIGSREWRPVLREGACLRQVHARQAAASRATTPVNAL